MFDTVIRNAKIYDGMGNPLFYANLGIRNGKIAAVTRLEIVGHQTIDAAGLVLTPGWIDSHSHMDGMLDREPRQQAKVEQGITTNIGGMCGESLAPMLYADGRRYDFAQYLSDIEQKATGANLAVCIGHGSLRSAVMGYSMKRPDQKQLDQMKRLADQAMQAGAAGLSFGLAYPPSSYADVEEMCALAAVAAKYDRPVTFHIRDEADHFEDAVAEVLEVAKRSGSRVILSHHKAMREKNWGKTEITLDMVDRAADEGYEIYADAHPYSTISAGLKAYIPQSYHSMGMERLTQLAGSRDGRAELIRTVEQALASGRGHYQQSDPPKAYILSSRSHPEYNGRRIMEIAEESGKSFAAAVVDTLYEDQMTTAGMHVDIMGAEDIKRVLLHPRVMVCTDGASILPGVAVNPRVVGTFPRFVGRMCIREGILPLERAVMKITSLPARVYGLKNKGIIREGMDADLVLFDPGKLLDNATVADYNRKNSGVYKVLIQGQVVAENGIMNEKMAGQIIRICPLE